jgi:uncharacterized protein YllA (UPF0747 family)
MNILTETRFQISGMQSLFSKEEEDQTVFIHNERIRLIVFIMNENYQENETCLRYSRMNIIYWDDHAF